MSVFFFQVAEALVDLGLIFAAFLAGFVLLVVQTDQVLACHVEAIKVFDCVFGAENVLVNNESGAFGLWIASFANLSDFAIFTEDVVELVSTDLVGEVADEEDAVDLGWKLFVALTHI